MRISGFDFSTNNMNKNNFSTGLQDFSTRKNTEKVAETAVPEKVDNVSLNNTPDKKEEDGTSVRISEDAVSVARAAKNQDTTNNFTTTNFSTDNKEAAADQKTITGNQILNQYRFFVPTTQYEGSEGVVKRIFG